VVPLALVCGRSLWSPHGLGVRREEESAVGAGRRRRYKAMKVGGGIFEQAHVAYLIDRGRALVVYLIGRGRAPLLLT
jgi:hypothetical protein